MSVSLPTVCGTYLSTAAVTTSGAVTMSATAPVGSLLMVTVGGAAASVTYAVSDSQGHTWTPLTLFSQGTGTLMSGQVFYTKITTALVSGVDTITVTRSTSNSLTWAAEYVTGQHTTTPIGNSGTTPSNSSSTTVTTLSTASVSAGAGDLTRGALVVTGNSINVTTGGVFDQIDTSIVSTTTNTRRMATASKQAASAETPTPTFSWNTANACCMMGYVIAAAPTSVPATVTFPVRTDVLLG